MLRTHPYPPPEQIPESTDINAKDGNGKTALILASERNNLAMRRLLIKGKDKLNFNLYCTE